mmetsp:Transcript_107331/g.341913  ORF Transcript_107331/g.341913 Transcript_107331/m.341913 type:complete len:313 (+) Transcript_107331:519-1457(+)
MHSFSRAASCSRRSSAQRCCSWRRAACSSALVGAAVDAAAQSSPTPVPLAGLTSSSPSMGSSVQDAHKRFLSPPSPSGLPSTLSQSWPREERTTCSMCCMRSAVSHWFSVCRAAICSSSCWSFRPCRARSPSSCSCSFSTSFSRTSRRRSNFSCLVIGCSQQRRMMSRPPRDSRIAGTGDAWRVFPGVSSGRAVRSSSSSFGVEASDGGSGRESRRTPRETRRETATEVPGESSRGLRSPSRGSWSSVSASETRRDQGTDRDTRREGAREAAAERLGVNCSGLSAFTDLLSSMGLRERPDSRSQREPSCGRG